MVFDMQIRTTIWLHTSDLEKWDETSKNEGKNWMKNVQNKNLHLNSLPIIRISCNYSIPLCPDFLKRNYETCACVCVRLELIYKICIFGRCYNFALAINWHHNVTELTVSKTSAVATKHFLSLPKYLINNLFGNSKT